MIKWTSSWQTRAISVVPGLLENNVYRAQGGEKFSGFSSEDFICSSLEGPGVF